MPTTGTETRTTPVGKTPSHATVVLVTRSSAPSACLDFSSPKIASSRQSKKSPFVAVRYFLRVS